MPPPDMHVHFALAVEADLTNISLERFGDGVVPLRQVCVEGWPHGCLEVFFGLPRRLRIDLGCCHFFLLFTHLPLVLSPLFSLLFLCFCGTVSFQLVVVKAIGVFAHVAAQVAHRWQHLMLPPEMHVHFALAMVSDSANIALENRKS